MIDIIHINKPKLIAKGVTDWNSTGNYQQSGFYITI